MAKYAAPGDSGSVVTFKARYENFIGGEYVAPVKGQYFENPTPITGQTFTEVSRSTVKGRGSGFSVEAPEGVRFMIRSRLFTDEESAALNGV